MADFFQTHQAFLVQHSHLLLNSYRHWLKQDLFPIGIDPVQNARDLYEAPFAVLSASLDEGHFLNYGNKTALHLWQMEWDVLRRTPSSQTAEPMHQEARAILLEKVLRQGFYENYEGIRISSRGERFWIKQATIWNLIDEHGRHAGQAATFPRWLYCE